VTNRFPDKFSFPITSWWIRCRCCITHCWFIFKSKIRFFVII